MKDRVSLYPGRVIMNPVPGQANTFDMVRADEPQEAGTPLNKVNLLSDETAQMFGFGEDDAIPDKALRRLLQKLNDVADLHVWVSGDGDYLVNENRNGYLDTEYTYLGQLGSKTPHMIMGSVATSSMQLEATVDLGAKPKIVFLYGAYNNFGNVASGLEQPATFMSVSGILTDLYVNESPYYHYLTETGFHVGYYNAYGTFYYIAFM